MTKRFRDFCEKFTIPHEGSAYENVPGDSGGPTKLGIDTASHPFLGAANLKNLTQEQALGIYFDSTFNDKLVCKEKDRTDWVKLRCEAMAIGLGESHFDAATNCGGWRANRFFTLSHGDIARYNDEREAYYDRLVQANPGLAKFKKGWINRVNDLRKFLNIS